MAKRTSKPVFWQWDRLGRYGELLQIQGRLALKVLEGLEEFCKSVVGVFMRSQ